MFSASVYVTITSTNPVTPDNAFSSKDVALFKITLVNAVFSNAFAPTDDTFFKFSLLLSSVLNVVNCELANAFAPIAVTFSVCSNVVAATLLNMLLPIAIAFSGKDILSKLANVSFDKTAVVAFSNCVIPFANVKNCIVTGK